MARSASIASAAAIRRIRGSSERYGLPVSLAAQKLPSIGIAVAHPCDDVSLESAVEAARLGFVQPILVGPLARIREIGPEHVIISSDVGLEGSPLHPDSLAWFAKQLRAAGVTERDLDLMYKDNPATALGLPLRRAGTR